MKFNQFYFSGINNDNDCFCTIGRHGKIFCVPGIRH